MRLVNADNIVQIMRRWKVNVSDDSTKDVLDMMIYELENEPTAFDIESVVSEINSKARTMSTANIPHAYYKAIGTNVCEEIIRNCGVKAQQRN